MKILGISCYYHDSAAALITNGVVTIALEEERFTRVKHDNAFPKHAIEACLRLSTTRIEDIDAIAYYEKPLVKFERMLHTFAETYPFSLKPFLQMVPEWLSEKILVEKTIRKNLHYKGKLFFIPHHYSHAAAAFFPSPAKTAAILTVDGVGEYQTTTLWHGKENRITLLGSLAFPHSLGLLYSTFTAFLGFHVNDDEYKVMGLAAYGTAVYKTAIAKLFESKQDGSFQLHMEYFRFREGVQMWSKAFEGLFGNPRKSTEPILKRHQDIAASIQAVTEDLYLGMLQYVQTLTGEQAACIGGGVALNAVANGKIFTRTAFKKAYVYGYAGDSGSAIGAGLYVYNQINGHERRTCRTLNIGSTYTKEAVRKILDAKHISYEECLTEKELLEKTAMLLKKNAIIGWFQGKMEFGPRALGARSILANPSESTMKDKVNRVKHREAFRPFAGAVLEKHTGELFEIPSSQRSFPFMTFCFQATEKGRNQVPAIIHQDNTCRVQTVSTDNGRFYNLLQEFFNVTGIPCLLNTSFNVKGEPIVENPLQAVHDFQTTALDYLVIDTFICKKP